jgi:hypothetical protein
VDGGMSQQITFSNENHGLIRGDILNHGDSQYIVESVQGPVLTVKAAGWYYRMRRAFARWAIDKLEYWAV